MPGKSPTPNQDLRAFYDGSYYAGRATGKLSWHLKRLAGRLLPVPGLRVLDVACGTGEWLAAARDRGAHVSGVDIASRAVAVAQMRLPGGVLAEATADALPFGPDTFDLVSCLGALEHFPDKRAALLEIRRVLRPDGRALVLVPNAGFLTRRLGLFRGTEQAAVREDVLSLDEWSRHFEDAGFRIDDRWRDLHVLSREWAMRQGWLSALPRLVQAVALSVWPLAWQYQVYHLLRPQDPIR